jgi:hypothetical protein
MMRVKVVSQGTRIRREGTQSSYRLPLFNCFHRFCRDKEVKSKAKLGLPL